VKTFRFLHGRDERQQRIHTLRLTKMETIFALASGLLPSAIAIVRLSGGRVREIVARLAGSLPAPRTLFYTTLTARDGMVIDQGLVAFFPAPHSFSGEDMAEFHLHGGPAVVERMLQELATFTDCRQAEAGEFARRAFANSKLDLTQAEGMADLIAAETESQRRLAVMGTSGALKALYRDWCKHLVKARALIEAELDFADEADVPGSVSDIIWPQLVQLNAAIREHIKEGERAQAMRDGVKIVIAGAPNAGKSSLINRLAGREVAIVTDEAGTTRDALEIRLVLAGMPVVVSDTAGLRQTQATIEQKGIDIAHTRMEEADLILFVEDMTDVQPVELPEITAPLWYIGNKLDQTAGDRTRWPVQISATNGQGFDELLTKLTSFCQERSVQITQIIPARRRQLDLLRKGVNELEAAIASPHLGLELRAEYLRQAGNHLGRIIGEVDVEDFLDIIFSEFCIGK